MSLFYLSPLLEDLLNGGMDYVTPLYSTYSYVDYLLPNIFTVALSRALVSFLLSPLELLRLRFDS